MIIITTAHEERYRGCTIRLEYDQNPESPREWDNVGTMVCWHGRYDLGDEQPKEDPSEYKLNLLRGDAAFDRADAWFDRILAGGDDDAVARARLHWIAARDGAMERSGLIMLPLYLYEHSGITISTGSFSCRWDSGQVGFIYCTMAKARKEWGEKYNPGITDKEIRAKAIACMKSEVKTYAAFLEGHVVGYIAEDPYGKQINSCWGYYPEEDDYAYAIREAKSDIDHWHTERDAEAKEKTYWEQRDTLTV